MAARVVSVITAVHPARAQHLGETFASLATQVMPPGWAWEWCLQVDGPGDLPVLAQHDAVRAECSGEQAGPADARNRALARARGGVVKVLDADDRLTPGQLWREVAVFDAQPEVDWITSRAVDVFPDGTTQTADVEPPAGRLARRAVVAHWRANGHRLLVHPATLAARTECVRALGGWMAMPAAEDTGLLLQLDVVCAGWFLAERGLLYRKWTGQTTAEPAYDDGRAERHAAIEARLGAMTP